jgi:hypothetical protein
MPADHRTSKAEDCRQKAADAERMAQQVKDYAAKQIYLQIAAH